MARSSRWRDAAAQAQSQPASPAPDAPAHPMPPVNAPVAGPPMPPFAPPVPVAGPSPRINPFAPPAPPAPPAAPVAAVASASELPEPPAPSAPSAPSATPSPPPTSSAPTAGSPVEADVAELRATLQQLQTTVSALVERSHEPSVPTGTPATDQASRIIVMANRAAESTLEEARAEIGQGVLHPGRNLGINFAAYKAALLQNTQMLGKYLLRYVPKRLFQLAKALCAG